MKIQPKTQMGFYVVAGLVMLTMAATPAQGQSAGAPQSKEAMLQRMIELDSAIENLKPQVAANPDNKSLQAQLDAAIAEGNQISAAAGGDRAPGRATGFAPASIAAPAVVPPAPSGCVPTTATFSNTTPVLIPDNNPTGATSTINVAGAGVSLWDVDVTVNIPHTFAADLDFTLTSPAGTVVTLSTDNGGGNDNTWAGTTFDDQANPGGQIPYTTNQGVTTDHLYANLTVATPLTPEEPLSAVHGQDPNGTWTLKVVDDLGGDSGTINSWSLAITTFPSAPTNDPILTVSNTTPVPIPDNNPAGATSTINVAGAGTSICDLDVTVNIPHTFAADIDLTLTSPAGTVVTLTTDNVWDGTTFNDQANPGGQIPYTTNNGVTTDNLYANLTVATSLTPEEPLAAFNGQDPNGTWTLKAVDDLGGDSGTITSWSLNVTTCACPAGCSITCPANVTVSNDPNQCGAVVTYPAPNTSGSCSTITCSPASGSFFPVGTTTVTCAESGGADCSFTVTVNDTQSPTITCPADVTQAAPPCANSAVVNYPAPMTFSDNCPNTIVVCAPASGSSFNVGTTPVTCTATDATGNSATCSFNATVTPTSSTPTLTTDASAAPTAGSPISDSATLADGCDLTGTVTFNLYGPDDASCGGAPVFTSNVAVTGDGTYTSDSFTPATVGTYRWIASYSGDANNNLVSGACNDPNESVTISAGVLRNLSTRMQVATGDNIGIGGFIITGSVPKRVIVRAIGPALQQFGLTGLLANPVLELHGPAGFITVTNDNWRDTQETEIAATNIPPTNDSESAIVVTLAPGAYTALVSGKNGTTGLALVEVFDLDPSAASELANISTRAFVNSGNNLVIAGFIFGQSSGDDSVAIRGLGPSLTAFGVPNVLANPALELRDHNGSLVFSDNDWQDNPPQAAAISAAGLAPTDAAEAAIFATLPAGAYTALLTGLNGGVGVGLVEIFQIGTPP